MTTYAAIGTFVLIGAVAARRTGRVWSGPAVAVVAGLVGHLVGIALTALLYFTVIVKDATLLTTFDMTGGWDEALGFTVVAPIVGALLACVGGLLSWGISRAWAGAVRAAGTELLDSLRPFQNATHVLRDEVREAGQRR